MRSLASADAKSSSDRKRRTVSISTVLIVALAAFAGIAYYFGSPPALPSVSAVPCTSQDPQIVIPQNAGVNSSLNFLPPTLTLVIGVNNTFGWDDQDTTSMHIVSSVSVPPDSVQWDLNMTGGHSYCITLTTPGTYAYEIRLSPVVEGIVDVKTA